MKKTISIFLTVVILITTLIIFPCEAVHINTSYRNAFISVLLNSEKIWLPYSEDSTVMMSRFVFMDLDFDGKNELIVQEAGGTLRNHTIKVYSYDETNQILKEDTDTGKEYYINLDTMEYYYNNSLGNYCILGSTILYAGVGNIWNGFYQLTFKNRDLNVEYYSSTDVKTDFYTHESTTSYYDGAEDWGKTQNVNIISKEKYDEINNQVMSQCRNVEVQKAYIYKKDWKKYDSSKKKQMLEHSYDYFSYDMLTLEEELLYKTKLYTLHEGYYYKKQYDFLNTIEFPSQKDKMFALNLLCRFSNFTDINEGIAYFEDENYAHKAYNYLKNDDIFLAYNFQDYLNNTTKGKLARKLMVVDGAVFNNEVAQYFDPKTYLTKETQDIKNYKTMLLDFMNEDTDMCDGYKKVDESVGYVNNYK